MHVNPRAGSACSENESLQIMITVPKEEWGVESRERKKFKRRAESRPRPERES
ncbi:hypothetical protein M407DRAFT_242659 [Tulasnella calospora MUT 4182]|uniref:Uncharacterized protein n=1 Tax=Tulasnella calospora MUT 4182 TaxID=1051891 RepID=A0A0C3QMY4_9AGAM|nr:hypothetical protein M407DRAFT_242659 [Tulasnella calospora MUT 4182]